MKVSKIAKGEYMLTLGQESFSIEVAAEGMGRSQWIVSNENDPKETDVRETKRAAIAWAIARIMDRRRA